jgi:hypothetical protein
LIAMSETPVTFKDGREFTVINGKWYGVYTDKLFYTASDLFSTYP